ncbi:MAG: xanthine dehydrogenase family protein molybdopterin-binding subunit [Bacillota bacterium]|jgi:xanthine dehydrogenase molybdenum-binding subunit
MSREFHSVGKRITQVDVAPKATGEARYTADIKLPGMLVGKVLHSPYPHANIKKIDTSKALALPGVEAVITFEDTPKVPYARSYRDEPMNASGTMQHSDEYILNEKCRYMGDHIAAVAAVDEKTADLALDLIEVEYEVLPFYIEPKDAMQPGAVPIHEWAPNNVPVVISSPPPYLKQGNVEKGLAESDVVIEETFFCSKQVGCHIETQACVANVDSNGRITVYSPSQLPHLFRRELAKMFKTSVGNINVVSPYVGGSFGIRLSCHNEPIAIALAMKARKPVKLVNTKEEDFTELDTRTPEYITIKMGFKKDGTLHAYYIDVTTWAGGYLGRAQLAGGIILTWGLGHYRCPNTDGRVKIVYTNTTPTGAMRGFGNPPLAWAAEQAMDMAAEKLGMDPVELRLKNVKKAGEPSNMCLPLESCYEADCLIEGAKAIGWKDKFGKLQQEGKVKRGVGVACMMHCSGAHPLLLEHSGAIIKFNEDGTASLMVNPGSPGTHIWGALAQIAAEELGIYPEDFNIVAGTTDGSLFDLGSHASRSTYVTGNAVLEAAKKAKGRLLARAAKTLGVSPDELDIKDRKIFVKAAPEKFITVADVCFDAIYNFVGECETIMGAASWDSKYTSPPTAAYFAEVEVDTETYEVKVINFVTAQDCGTAINPMTVEGQCEGGLQQGLGYALTEDYYINRETGKCESDNFTTYKIPGTLDMPENTKVIIINKPDPKGPFGAKGVGEPGSVGVTPAIGNAIYNAIGVRITDLPVTPEKIYAHLRQKAKSK